MPKITYAWIESCRSPRLAAAQETLRKSILDLGLEPDLYRVGPDLFKFGDLLRHARASTDADAFVWCNSDVILRKNPYDLPERNCVHGFVRTEIPSGHITYGVDMYLIPNTVWDELLSKDIPDLYCGTSFVDWWVTRCAQLHGSYRWHAGYIDHVTHERSSAALSGGDRYYRHNQREYNRWAKRHGAGIYQAHFAPGLWRWMEACRKRVRGWVS